ncbi:MAG: type II toxin-antitoxin system RatA family toxin [Pseudomonadota bacterium]
MQKFTERKRVSFSAEQMYSLVAAVEHYSEYLPWCQSSRLLQRDDASQTAEITVSKGPLRQSFTTRNQLEPVNRLGIELVRGPFKSLHGEWRFAARDDGCDVSLALEFEFSNRLLDITAGPVFKEVNRAMVDAFVRRAAQLYG